MAEEQIPQQVDAFLAGWFQMRQSVMEANFHRAHQQGVSTTQFMVMNLLSEKGSPWTLRRLATALNLEPATLVGTVDSLEQRGVVVRQRDTHDRRHVHISLTPLGSEMQTASQTHFRTRLAHIFQAMSSADRHALIAGLAAFATAAQTPQEEETHVEL